MDRKTVHILIVDDDDVDAEGVVRAIERSKIANPVYRAGRDGVEALEMLRGSEDTKPVPQPNLILLDLKMPRMNGIQFLNELRRDERLHRSVVFVLSTSQDEQDKLAAYEKHIAGYVSKAAVGEDFSKLIELLNYYWRIVELPIEQAA